MHSLRMMPMLAIGVLTLGACDGDGPTDAVRDFLQGTRDEAEIGLVVRSTGKALTLFQLGEPAQTREVAFGASSDVTPVGMAVRGTRAIVPLGNAASVAVVDLETQRIERFFLFPNGNATGAAWVNDTTVLVSNIQQGYVGKFTLRQANDTIKQTVSGPAGDIHVAGNRALVVSSNYDFAVKYPLGFRQGTVTAVDIPTMTVVGSVGVGTNSQSGAIGADGLLYVLNTGNYFAPGVAPIPGSISVVNPQTLQVVSTHEGFGNGPGSIMIDGELAYISGFFFGTLVWNTRTRQFVRGPENPVCAKVANATTGAQVCRGAFDNDTDEEGNLYQTFFGSARNNLKPWVFKYRAGTYELIDSIAVGAGPTAIEIRKF